MNIRKEMDAHKRVDGLMERLRQLGADDVRNGRNEFGAVEVTFSAPYCDPGKRGWGVGYDLADALQSAVESASYLKHSAKRRGVAALKETER